jgi:hypothetical protein
LPRFQFWAGAASLAVTEAMPVGFHHPLIDIL